MEETTMKIIRMNVDIKVPISMFDVAERDKLIKVKRYGSPNYLSAEKLYNDAVMFAFEQDVRSYAMQQLPDPTMCRSIAIHEAFSEYTNVVVSSACVSLSLIKGRTFIKHFIHNDDEYILVCPIVYDDKTLNNIYIEYAGNYAVYKCIDLLHLPELVTTGRFDLEASGEDDGACPATAN